MSNAKALSAAAVALLLDVLEQPEPLLSAAAAETRSAEAASLVATGLLIEHDVENVAISGADHDDVPVSLSWSQDAGSLTYFSAGVGPVCVAAGELRRHCVDTNRLLREMIVDFDLP